MVGEPTEEIRLFKQRLQDMGAEKPSLREATMVGMFAYFSDRKESCGNLSRPLDTEESARFTEAWWNAFPEYLIAGLPREINRLLEIVRREGGHRSEKGQVAEINGVTAA